MSGAAVNPSHVAGYEMRPLEDEWEAAVAAPGQRGDPAALDGLRWRAARVPGTAAGVLRDAGLWELGDLEDFDAQDWWFRTRFAAAPAAAGEEVVLRLDGIATVADVHLNDEHLVHSESMFASHALDVGERLRGENELVIHCRALGPLLKERRRPRARWRTRVVAEGNLRFFRTSLLGRAPGFSPAPAPVGPWRPVCLERRRGLVVDELALRPQLLPDGAGVLSVRARLRGLGATLTSVAVELSGPSGTHAGPLELRAQGQGQLAVGELTVPAVAQWWPHTHGEPVLHDVRLALATDEGTVAVEGRRVGFRTLAPGARPDVEAEEDGLDLHVNGVGVFVRGAVWTPVDAVGLAPGRPQLRAALEQVRDAGMNMLRVIGVGTYEEEAFHELCDELGILVWQDFMFANLDYSIADEHFRALVEEEAAALLRGVAGRPSLAVLCGNSEVEQQAAMFGLDPALARGELFGEILPRLVAASGADALYLPSAPCGGDLPFRPDRGVANYFGVGAYLRPLADVRTAGVRFASECLAFANVPDEAAIHALLPDAPASVAVHHPRWKAGVPRDVGAGWDFEDVRDHYLAQLFAVSPGELRHVDHERYLDLSRAVSGEVMAEVFAQWRRQGSRCGGGLVLWLRDLLPGAGWGLLDSRGEPKVAYHHLRRALAPIAVWTTDEGLGGIVIHAANDRGAPLACRLRVALYRDLEQRVEEAQETLVLAAHGACERNIEAMLGRFVDASWAYRFGPPAQDAIVVSLEQLGDDAVQLLSQCVHFPAGRPIATDRVEELGLEAGARRLDPEALRVEVRTRRLAYGVRVHVPGFAPDDDAFAVEPGGRRVLLLRARDPNAEFTGGAVTALNMAGRIRLAPEART